MEAAINASATTINIPDTVGYTMPFEYANIISGLYDRVPNIDKAIISVHTHDDLGIAVGNALAAVHAGARQVEGAMNGIGERAKQLRAGRSDHGDQSAQRHHERAHQH